ncbi:MAG TPA: Asp/Glu/hydantoin racemase [Caldithrix abyssi]|uniref:Asp/Glu/hydantoin racemase n=1 Tax=Caldithrix abyssi TaxID=187145 RepID=A0A7V4U084_CALAY|nr:Asp/Glu/hydantoin racemase [Caldithrix abyssi]
MNKLLFNLAILAIFFASFNKCTQNPPVVEGDIRDVILENRHPYFSLDVTHYPQKDKTLPVGIFDSGTGGLAVLDVILNFDKYNNSDLSYSVNGDGVRDFSGEYFVYLGDQANMPYGNYEKEHNVPLLKEHVIKDVHFLLDKKYYPTEQARRYKNDKSPVKAIVIACNTATAYGKNDIEAFLERAGLDIKVIGVIDAGVRAALEVIGKEEDASIGVMATAGTVASQGYVRTLREQIKQLGYTGRIEIFQQAGVGLAGAIDGASDYIAREAQSCRSDYRGPSDTNSDVPIDTAILGCYNFDWSEGKMLYEGDRSRPEHIQINSIKNYIAYHVVSLMEQIRKAPDAPPLKAVILGCTHYPFFTDEFAAQFARLYQYKEKGRYVYRHLMAEHIPLLDPSENTAKELFAYLKSAGLLNNSDLKRSEFYISVPNRNNPNIQLDSLGQFTYAYKYGRKAGRIQEYVKRVPFSKKVIPGQTVQRLQNKIPFTFELIRAFNRQNDKTAALTEAVRF